MDGAIENWIDFNWFDGSEELDSIHAEHIWEMMKAGYTSGELVDESADGTSKRGWWNKKKR